MTEADKASYQGARAGHAGGAYPNGGLTQVDDLFRRIAEAVPDILYVLDLREGRNVYINREVWRVLGYTPEQVLGMDRGTLESLVHPGDLPRAREDSRRLDGLADKDVHEYEYRMRHAGGEYRVLKTRDVVFERDAEGRATKVLGVVQDVTEQRRAEEANRRLAAIVESTDDAVLSRSLEGAITSWNKGAERMYGYAAEEVVGRHVSLLIPEDHSYEVRDIIELARLGESQRLETVRVRKDGRPVDVALTISAINDPGGQTVGASIIARDITERRRAEEKQSLLARHAVMRAEVSSAFNESDGSLRAVLQMCAEAVVRHMDAAFARIWTLDAAGDVLELQASAGLYTRLDGGHARVPVGSDKIGLIASERKPHLTNCVPDDGRVRDAEWARREGMTSFAGYPLIVARRLVGVIGMFARHALDQDALEALESVAPVIAQGVERRRAEEGLRESQQLLQAVIENSTALVHVKDLGGRYLLVNRGFEELVGRPRDSILGKNEYDVFPAGDAGRYREFDRRVVDAGGVLETEETAAGVNGERTFITTKCPLFDSEGRPYAVCGISTDITERKQSEVALREAQAGLAHLSRVMTVGELTSSIAHEINQPLAAVVMNANAALRWLAFDPPDVAKARSSAESIIRDGERAGQVISRVRALLKKAPPSKALVDVGELAREVIALTHHEVVRNKVSLKTDLGRELPPVSGDRIQLQQVMINLTVNAVESMAAVAAGPRELLIAAGKEGGGVRVTVSDTGGGFDPRDAERLFEAFYTTKPGGMGMGLAISRSIVAAHGGRFWAEPNERGGAAFHFTLPGGEEA